MDPVVKVPARRKIEEKVGALFVVIRSPRNALFPLKFTIAPFSRPRKDEPTPSNVVGTDT
jgi:hypothetical protein